MEQKPLKSGNKAVINREKCKHDDCLKCMTECDIVEAISKANDGSPVVSLDKCSGCGGCVEVCPNKAIGIFWLEGTEPDPPHSKFATW